MVQKQRRAGRTQMQASRDLEISKKTKHMTCCPYRACVTVLRQQYNRTGQDRCVCVCVCVCVCACLSKHPHSMSVAHGTTCLPCRQACPPTHNTHAHTSTHACTHTHTHTLLNDRVSLTEVKAFNSSLLPASTTTIHTTNRIRQYYL